MPATHDNGQEDLGIARPPEDLLAQVRDDVARAGGALVIDPEREGAIGATMFDLPGSSDNSVTALLPRDHAQRAPSQGLVRIKSRDGRRYLGIVTAGPFAEPDTLRADSHLLVTVTARGGIYLPPYHGRVEVNILGEEQEDGTLAPPRLRPLPNSPVFPLSEEESEQVLGCRGDLRLGRAVGHEKVQVGIPSEEKSVLPRHTAILGTTGGGKSTTVAGLVCEARRAGMAVVLLDVEGEYSHLHEKTDDPKMLTALRERGLEPGGVPAEKMTLYHLIGRGTRNPHHPHRRPFSLQFARLSPYTVMEVLGLSDAQRGRFMVAYDIAKELLRRLDIFPRKGKTDEERLAMDLDEFERGCPRLTPALLLDVVGACHDHAGKKESTERSRGKPAGDEDAGPALRRFAPRSKHLQTDAGAAELRKLIHANGPYDSPISWRALIGKLSRLQRLKVFYSEEEDDKQLPLNYKALLRPGTLSVLDLSDTGMSELNNLVIADLLHGLHEAQDDAYTAYERAKEKDPKAPPPTRVLVVVEEAHEFLSAERIDKMDILFEQVARIAKRGRKRWLGLVFVTQLPQHLPHQLFGLVNNYILHKITDPQVVAALRKTVSNIDAGLWERLPGLAPGQALVSFPHMARPLLVSIDPTGAKLRLVD